MLKDIIDVKGGFVRAVKLADYFDKELNRNKLESYYPIPEARDAFYNISRGLHPTSKGRAHIISGTYGSGKSHFALVIANYLTKNSDSKDLKTIFDRIWEKDAPKAQEIYNIRNVDKPYLLILIEGYDPGGVEHALLNGLKEALTDSQRGNLPEEDLETSYSTAIKKIKEWEDKKPDFFKELKKCLDQNGTEIKTLLSDLKEFKEDALRLFREIHHQITLSDFDPFFGYKKVSEIYHEICEYLIKEKGFKGIAIIWDQFNDHLESISPAYLGKEASLIRNFAETVERSGETQLHLILISHNLPHTYIQDKISKESLDNWMTVEGRFEQQYKLAAIEEVEELIDYILIQKTGIGKWKEVERKIDGSTQLLDSILEMDLYLDKKKEWIKETILKGAFPLHPVTTYCLPRISDVVGQQARTMFTFFEDALGLKGFIEDTPIFDDTGQLNFYTAERLFDFFRNAIENNFETRNIIRNYDETMRRVIDPDDTLTQKVIKMLAILDTIKVGYSSIPILKTPFHLSTILKEEEKEIETLLEAFKENKTLWKATNGEYEFSSGRVLFDFEGDLRKEKSRIILDNPILKLKDERPLQNLRAKEYERDYEVERKLLGDYITPDGLDSISRYENLIKNGYEDGLILYVITESKEEIKRARELAVNIKNPQIVVAIPKDTIEVYAPLRTKIALDQLAKKAPYDKKEGQAYGEWKDKYDSEANKLDIAIANFYDLESIELFWKGGTIDSSGLKKVEEIADVVMRDVFNKTPIVKHRKMANINEQDQRADRIRLNTAILDITKKEISYVAKGRVPAEKTILVGTFDPQGMLRKRSEGSYDHYEIIKPQNSRAKEVWNIIEEHLLKEKSDFKGVLNCLRSPPYGLCSRVIELFLSAFFREYRPRFEIKIRKTKRTPLEKKEFVGETIYEIVNKYPDKTLIEYREHLPQEENYLKIIMKAITDNELTYSPLSEDVGKTLVNWFRNLPIVTKSSSNLSDECKTFVVNMREITKNDNMHEVLFKELPKVSEIVKDFAFWEESDLEEFKAKFVGIINELSGYPEIVKRDVKKMLTEVFDVKGDTDDDITGKNKHWYNELPAYVKESTKYLTPDEKILLKHAGIGDTSQFEKRFLEDMPREMGLDEYLNWENVKNKLHTYRTKLVGAKKQLEKRKELKPSKKEDKKHTVQLKLSTSAVALETALKREINTLKAKLKEEEIVAVLNKLLEEFKK